MASRDFVTVDGDVLPWLEKDPMIYVDRSTLIIGGTGSGKTTIIFEILDLINPYIDNGIVIVDQNSRKNYVNRFHDRCIMPNISKEKLIDILDRQTQITECYNIANAPVNLKALVDRLNNRFIQMELVSISHITNKAIQKVQTSDLSESDKLTHIANIEELKINRERDYRRAIIREHREQLNRMPLSPDERTALKYLDLNNRLLILCDDISTLFKTWMSYFKTSEKNPIQSFFYEGRHAGITFVSTVHDDTIIDPKLRKNARNIIYCNQSVLLTSVNHKSSGFARKDIAFIEKVSAHLYHSTGSIKNHRKFCYIREDPQPFKYTIAKTSYPIKRFISDALWELCDKLPRRESKEKNKFIEQDTDLMFAKIKHR
jgi:energy-coupling factor transporter ATP-binding protein EcfA2